MENYQVLIDRELIQQCIDGNRKFQEMLYNRFASKMFGICLGYISDRDSAKDVLQEAFIKVFSNLKSYKNNSGAFRKFMNKF